MVLPPDRRAGHVEDHAGSTPGRVERPAYDPAMAETTDATAGWTFLTNHAHVLVCLARDPELRQRDLSALIGITERATQVILGDLEASGYLTRERVGRRNRYQLALDRPLRHPLEASHSARELIDLLRL